MADADVGDWLPEIPLVQSGLSEIQVIGCWTPRSSTRRLTRLKAEAAEYKGEIEAVKYSEVGAEADAAGGDGQGARRWQCRRRQDAEDQQDAVYGDGGPSRLMRTRRKMDWMMVLDNSGSEMDAPNHIEMASRTGPSRRLTKPTATVTSSRTRSQRPRDIIEIEVIEDMSLWLGTVSGSHNRKMIRTERQSRRLKSRWGRDPSPKTLDVAYGPNGARCPWADCPNRDGEGTPKTLIAAYGSSKPDVRAYGPLGPTGQVGFGIPLKKTQDAGCCSVPPSPPRRLPSP